MAGGLLVASEQELCSVSFFLPHGVTASSGPEPNYRGFAITLRHTTLGRTPLDE